LYGEVQCIIHSPQTVRYRMSMHFGIVSCFLSLYSITALSSRPCENGFIPFPSTSALKEYKCFSAADAFNKSMEYLEKNLPSFDKINKASLGFNTVGSVDNNGVARIGTNHSLEMRNKYKWAADVPYDIFLEYVLPYGVVNEGRNNWRFMLSEIVIRYGMSGVSCLQLTCCINVLNCCVNYVYHRG
jgi:hypothetical protein